MPIGTSDGQYFEDENEYAISQIPRITVTPLPKEETEEQPFQLDRSAEQGLKTLAEMTFPPFDWEKFKQVAPMSPNVEDRRRDDPRGFYADPTNPGVRIHRFDDAGKNEPEYYGQRAIEGLAGVVRDYVTPRAHAAKEIAQGFTGTHPTKERIQTPPEKMVRGFINSLSVLKGVSEGTVDYRDPGAISAAFEVAGAVILGPAPIARKAIDGTLGSIGGVSAKKAPLDTLKQAESMRKAGDFSREQIWKETGWYRGADGEWKWEISNSSAALNKKPLELVSLGEERRLNEVLDHRHFFDNYPQFRGVKVSYDPKTNFVAYVTDIKNEPRIFLGEAFMRMKPEQQLNTMIHEAQHLIQRAEEGFSRSRGGFESNADALFTAIAERTAELKDINPELAKDFAERALSLVKQAKQKGDVGEQFYMRDPAEMEANIAAIRSYPYMSAGERAAESPQKTAERLFGTPLKLPSDEFNVINTKEPSVTQFRRASNENIDVKKLSIKELDEATNKAYEEWATLHHSLGAKASEFIRTGKGPRETPEETEKVGILYKRYAQLYDERQRRMDKIIDKEVDKSDKQKFKEAVKKQQSEIYKVVDAKDAKTADEWRRLAREEKVFISGRPNAFAMARKHSLDGKMAVVIRSDGRRTIYKDGRLVHQDKRNPNDPDL